MKKISYCIMAGSLKGFLKFEFISSTWDFRSFEITV